jgi:CheY-like chemotaxis protein
MTVLIIEPDKILVKEYAKAFKQSGFKVQTCSDAQKAVTLCDASQPDAIILELQMAGHNGVEFLHEFRSYDDWNAIPIFIYSCIPEYALGTETKSWESYGVIRYFYKPNSNLNQLIGAVKGELLK